MNLQCHKIITNVPLIKRKTVVSGLNPETGIRERGSALTMQQSIHLTYLLCSLNLPLDLCLVTSLSGSQFFPTTTNFLKTTVSLSLKGKRQRKDPMINFIVSYGRYEVFGEELIITQQLLGRCYPPLSVYLLKLCTKTVALNGFWVLSSSWIQWYNQLSFRPQCTN